MSERIILSEKLEDNIAAAEWGIKQAELIKKGEEITQRLKKNIHLLFYHVMYKKQLAVPTTEKIDFRNRLILKILNQTVFYCPIFLHEHSVLCKVETNFSLQLF